MPNSPPETYTRTRTRAPTRACSTWCVHTRTHLQHLFNPFYNSKDSHCFPTGTCSSVITATPSRPGVIQHSNAWSPLYALPGIAMFAATFNLAALNLAALNPKAARSSYLGHPLGTPIPVPQMCLSAGLEVCLGGLCGRRVITGWPTALQGVSAVGSYTGPMLASETQLGKDGSLLRRYGGVIKSHTCTCFSIEKGVAIGGAHSVCRRVRTRTVYSAWVRRGMVRYGVARGYAWRGAMWREFMAWRGVK